VLTGIDDVDWASMGHAYTDSATDVPDLLWGLASEDPARRDIALDGLYGAVHHQGDVYDSTVACIPFLFELASMPGLPDRAAIVRLLCGIAGGRNPDPAELDAPFEDERENAAYVQLYLDAWAGVRERADAFLTLLGDTDPEVRAAATEALAEVHPQPARVFDALRGRLPVERDPGALRALVGAIGELAGAHPEQLGDTAEPVLREMVLSGGADHELRLAALVQLARCAPRTLPAHSVRIALDTLRSAYERKASAARAAGPARERPRTDTMVSYLRDLEATHYALADSDATPDLLLELHHALGDRTDLRFPLLLGQLGSADWGQRMAAIRMAGALMTGWRLPDDEPLVALAGQLREPELRLNKAALTELRYLAPVARVVADDVVAFVEDWWESGRTESMDGLRWLDTAIGRAMEVLALQGDDRALNALKSVLSRLDPPEETERWLTAYGPEAGAELGPVLHERLADLDPADRGVTRRRLLDGLGILRHRPSLPRVIAALRDSGEDAATGRHALKALARYGTAAAEAAPLLRERVSDATARDPDRTEAAAALWAVTGDAEAVLPALRAGLRSERRYERRAALQVIGSLGPAAVSLATSLRGTDPQGVDEAVALWRITGDAEEALPVLSHHWTAQPVHRPGIAACLVEVGPAAAPALPLVRAELSSPRRHRTDITHETAHAAVNVRGDVASDEELLRDCRRIVAACGTG
jgi:hypothetical protein